MSAPLPVVARPAAPPWALAWRLSLGQILAWGVLYYTFTVVVGPLQADTGWSRPLLNAGLSAGLLAGGLCAYPVGLWIQRRGARGLMAGANLLGAVALALMGLAETPAVYFAAWLLLGAAMAGALYDPAFAVITAEFGAEYRRGITLVTLVGGLASTAFIPLAQLLVDQLGWRLALLSLAGLVAGVGGPLHAWGVPGIAGRPAASENLSTAIRLRRWWTTFRRDVADPRFAGMAVWLAGYAMAVTGLVFQLIPLLQSVQVANDTIVAAITVMGPMQVAGRLFLSTRRDGLSSLHLGVVAMACLLASLFLLMFLPGTLLWLGLFAALLGLGNGMLTIVRGAAVAEVFGRDRYAEINGALAAPAMFAKAAAPLVLAGVWTATGSARAVVVVTLVVAGVGLLGLLAVLRRGQVPSGASAPCSAA